MWDAACPCACVFACVVCLCVCVLSSWHSSTNLSSIQIFHSDGKRPDSNSIVPLKCPFPFVDVHFYNKICHVLKGQMPGLGQMWDPVMIFTCQIVSNPRLRPRGGGGGGSHVTMIGALNCDRNTRAGRSIYTACCKITSLINNKPNNNFISYIELATA